MDARVPEVPRAGLGSVPAHVGRPSFWGLQPSTRGVGAWSSSRFEVPSKTDDQTHSEGNAAFKRTLIETRLLEGRLHPALNFEMPRRVSEEFDLSTCSAATRFRTADSDASRRSHGPDSWTQPWITPRRPSCLLRLFDLDLLRRAGQRCARRGWIRVCALQEYHELVLSLRARNCTPRVATGFSFLPCEKTLGGCKCAVAPQTFNPIVFVDMSCPNELLPYYFFSIAVIPSPFTSFEF